MQQAIRMGSIVILIVLSGAVLYMLIERVSFVDGLYFTLATISTVGYGDIVPLTRGGRIVAMLLMIGGVGVALYVFTAVMSFVVEGRLRRVLGVRKMKKAIERMQGHFIICGYGKLGKMVVRELESNGADFVIVETNPQKVADAREKDHPVVEGDATHQEILATAGLERAAGLAATISDDAENLYIGITARSMYAGLPVVCRSSTDRVRTLFKRAGIERTISTDEIGARRLVSSLVRPHVVEFMDELLVQTPSTPTLHAIQLQAGAPLIGQTIQGARLRDEFGIVVLAIQRAGTFLPNPGPRETLEAEDITILLGLSGQVARLRDLLEVGGRDPVKG